MTSGPERRQFTRLPIGHLHVEVRWPNGGATRGFASDVSLSGLFLPCSDVRHVATPCNLVLSIAEETADARWRAEARVAHASAGGLGFQFTAVPLDTLDHLKNLILLHADDPDQVQREFDEHLGIKPRPTA